MWLCCLWCPTWVNTLRPRQDGCYFADDVLKCIFLNENVWISLKIPLKFFPKGPINNIPALVQIMAWRRPGNKPLCEPMLVFVPMHICVTQPQWVNTCGLPLYNTANFQENTYDHDDRHSIALLGGQDFRVWCNWPALCAGLLCCNFFDILTPVPYHHFFSSLILLFIYV